MATPDAPGLGSALGDPGGGLELGVGSSGLVGVSAAVSPGPGTSEVVGAGSAVPGVVVVVGVVAGSGAGCTLVRGTQV